MRRLKMLSAIKHGRNGTKYFITADDSGESWILFLKCWTTGWQEGRVWEDAAEAAVEAAVRVVGVVLFQLVNSPRLLWRNSIWVGPWKRWKPACKSWCQSGPRDLSETWPHWQYKSVALDSREAVMREDGKWPQCLSMEAYHVTYSSVRWDASWTTAMGFGLALSGEQMTSRICLVFYGSTLGKHWVLCY